MNYNVEYWEKRYAEMGRERTAGHRDWTPEQYKLANDTFFDKIKKLFKPAELERFKGCSLLDYGIGGGRAVPYLRNIFRPGMYTGADIVDNKVTGIDKFIHISDTNDISETEQFDLIWVYVVLQHIVDSALLQRAVMRLYNALQPGGLMVVTESGDTKVKSSSYFISRSARQYIDLFKKVGFKVRIVMVDNISSHAEHYTYFLTR